MAIDPWPSTLEQINLSFSSYRSHACTACQSPQGAAKPGRRQGSRLRHYAPFDTGEADERSLRLQAGEADVPLRACAIPTYVLARPSLLLRPRPSSSEYPEDVI